MVSSMSIDRMFPLLTNSAGNDFACEHVCVIAQRDIRNVVISVFFLCLHVLSFLFSLFVLTWFHLHYFGGVCVKAICWCCEEKLLPIPTNLSCCAVDPGKCFECHLLDENCKCNLQEHL